MLGYSKAQPEHTVDGIQAHPHAKRHEALIVSLCGNCRGRVLTARAQDDGATRTSAD